MSITERLPYFPFRTGFFWGFCPSELAQNLRALFPSSVDPNPRLSAHTPPTSRSKSQDVDLEYSHCFSPGQQDLWTDFPFSIFLHHLWTIAPLKQD